MGCDRLPAYMSVRMGSRPLFLASGLALTVSLWAHPGPLRAEPSAPEPGRATAAATAATPTLDPAQREQLRALVRQAGERMERGDRAGAVALLEQARAIRADPSIDYNLGVAYAELGRHPQAAEAFERFLPAADPAKFLPERLDDVRKRLASYAGSLARVRAHYSLPSGGAATLYLNDRALGPLRDGRLPPQGASDTRWIEAGSYRVRVAGPGLRDYVVSVDIRPGETRDLTGDVMGDGTGAALLGGEPVVAKEGPRPFYKKPWFWGVVGGGAVVTISLIAAGASGAFTHTAPGSDLDSVDLFTR